MTDSKVEEEVNEFENIDTEDQAPEQSFSDGGEDVLAGGSAGVEYDFDKAPEYVRAPPRVDMDGQETTVVDAKIIFPPTHKKWELSRDRTKEYKYCVFKLFYENGQQEFYSGVRVFKVEEGKNVKYSHPTIMRDRKNQASKLLGLYADFKNKDINEVSLKEFLSYLKSKPKVKITAETFKNPNNEKEVKKNIVGSFL